MKERSVGPLLQLACPYDIFKFPPGASRRPPAYRTGEVTCGLCFLVTSSVVCLLS